MPEEALQLAEERKEVKGKGEEKERYTLLIAEFQRSARRDKEVFSKNNAKKSKNNRVGKTIEISSRKLERSGELFLQRWA